MNYQRIYDLLIENARIISPVGYSENHHIIPRCLGGGDEPENLIRLSARQHFVAHLLLAKIHGGLLVIAAWGMSNDGKHTSRKYEWLRRRHAIEIRKINLGRKLSPEHRAKIAKGLLGTTRTPEQKARMSLIQMGNKKGCGPRRKRTPEHAGKIAASLRGRKQPDDLVAKRTAKSRETRLRNGPYIVSAETRAKISQTLSGRKSAKSPEERYSMSIAMRGNQYGKANKGKKLTSEHCANISRGRLGKKFSAEHRAALSRSHMGKTAWNKGMRKSA